MFQIELQEGIGLERNQTLVGSTVEVLVAGSSRRDARDWLGKTDTFKTTVFPREGTCEVSLGSLVRVQVVGCTSHTLLGSLEPGVPG